MNENETVFKEILGEWVESEFAEFDNAPEHKFSLRHRLAMKRIFARYEKNVRKLKEAEGTYTPFQSEKMPYYGIKQRLIYALVIVLIMTMLTGCVISIRGITEMQIDWLRSRYDFPNMKMSVGETFDIDPNKQTQAVGIFWETKEYGNFLADLVDMGLYTEDEVETIRLKPSPLDTRPQRNGELRITPVTIKLGDESPLESYRDYVSRLEERIEHYSERAKDPLKAVEGDKEFAELIAEHYLPLPKSFLELLEKLYADDPDKDENPNNQLADLDKDDRRYLCEINEI